MTAPLTDAQAAQPADRKITVRIDSSRPIFIEADVDSFGAIFAGLNDDEQIDVLRAMVEHMKPHRLQWDYISIKLEAEENSELAREIADALFPGLRAERDALRAERDAAREFVKRHPSLSLIDLAEFEAFLKVPAAIDSALTSKGGDHG